MYQIFKNEWISISPLNLETKYIFNPNINSDDIINK